MLYYCMLTPKYKYEVLQILLTALQNDLVYVLYLCSSLDLPISIYLTVVILRFWKYGCILLLYSYFFDVRVCVCMFLYIYTHTIFSCISNASLLL